jgi:hypothetical protein
MLSLLSRSNVVFVTAEEHWVVMVTEGNPLSLNRSGGEAARRKGDGFWSIWVLENSFWGSGDNRSAQRAPLLYDEIYDPTDLLFGIVGAMGWIANVIDTVKFQPVDSGSWAWIETYYYGQSFDRPFKFLEGLAACEVVGIYDTGADAEVILNLLG